jgi:hypothetical protein
VYFYAARGILIPQEEYAEYAKYSFQYAYSIYSAYLLTSDAQNKALRNRRNPTPPRTTFVFTPLF